MAVSINKEKLTEFFTWKLNFAVKIIDLAQTPISTSQIELARKIIYNNWPDRQNRKIGRFG